MVKAVADEKIGQGEAAMALAFVFPGQGSQTVGMGKALADAYPAAAAVFAEVDDALGEKLSDVIWSGPADALTMTANTQPALMAVSLAALRALEAEGIALADTAAFVAGHSLGEYSALAAAGALTVADAARLLRIRGNAMQAAVPVGEGSMAALLGVDFETAEAIAVEAAAEGGICQAANDNAPGQVVVSGHKAAVERAVAIAKGQGKKGMMLPVSAPFHCALMRPAAEAMHEALSAVMITPPVVPVVTNVTARPTEDPAEIRDRLVEQVTGTVRWRESIGWLSVGAGVDRFLEVGNGKALSGMIARIAPDAATARFGVPADIEGVRGLIG